MEKFIYEKHNSLSNSICNDLIEFLEIKEDKTVNTIKIADEKINNYLNIEKHCVEARTLPIDI